MVYQQFINYPSLSVYENIASPLRVQGLPRAAIETRVRDAAKLLRLDPYLDRKPLNLSGGQQQRTAIARALVKQADLVLLDEPLANLDYKLREELREELPRVFAASGAIFVYATTEPSEALLLGGNTATLFEGRVTQFGPTPRVFRDPYDLATARVFSDPPLNTLTVRKANGMVSFSTGGQTKASGVFLRVPDGEYTVGFRAHHLGLEPVGAESLSIEATVSVAEITGSESYIHLDAGTHRFVALTPGVKRVEPGAPITTYLDPRHIFLFDGTGRTAAGDFVQAA
jgi:glycerol transport system ATP-binding protein